MVTYKLKMIPKSTTEQALKKQPHADLESVRDTNNENINQRRYQTIQVGILMWSLWEVMSGQCCYPLTHLFLNQQHLHIQETHIYQLRSTVV